MYDVTFVTAAAHTLKLIPQDLPISAISITNLHIFQRACPEKAKDGSLIGSPAPTEVFHISGRTLLSRNAAALHALSGSLPPTASCSGAFHDWTHLRTAAALAFAVIFP